MNTQKTVQPRNPAGYGRRKGDRDTKYTLESEWQLENSVPIWSTSAAVPGMSIGHTDGARDRLMFLISCFIGQRVDVQVKNGTVYTGIFHSTNAGKDFGVILKMAQLLKDASGQKSGLESFNRSPIKTFIIPADELVQVIAKDVLVTIDGVSSAVNDVKEKDILIDSYISQSRPGETERELKRWVPDDTDPVCSNLDNVFDTPWNRGWDQFQTNEALFGVKSTFDEELYTTKLLRGTQTRELEREALRLAREIEREETHDLHLAEERGVLLDEQFDIDEESKYSSVLRKIDDGRYEENNDLVADSYNDDTFGVSMTSTSAADHSALPPCVSSPANGRPCPPSSGIDLRSNSNFNAEKSFISGDCKTRGLEDQVTDAQASAKEFLCKQVVVKNAYTLKDEGAEFDLQGKDDSSKKGPPNVTASTASGNREQVNTGQMTESTEMSQFRASQNEPNLLKSCGLPGLSPSSSVGSLSSEKSTLNPYAKEFKLNPNAKSFVPTKVPSRPPSPSSNGSFYYPNSGPQMPGMAVGLGIGPSFVGHQPVVYNPQGASHQSPQGYFHPNGPQYGHHNMVLGSSRPVMYMPGYPQEMPYKREY